MFRDFKLLPKNTIKEKLLNNLFKVDYDKARLEYLDFLSSKSGIIKVIEFGEIKSSKIKKIGKSGNEENPRAERAPTGLRVSMLRLASADALRARAASTGAQSRPQPSGAVLGPVGLSLGSVRCCVITLHYLVSLSESSRTFS